MLFGVIFVHGRGFSIGRLDHEDVSIEFVRGRKVVIVRDLVGHVDRLMKAGEPHAPLS